MTAPTSLTAQIFAFFPSQATASDAAPWRPFASWHDVLASEEKPLGFYLENFTSPGLRAMLRQIRRSRWWFLPIIGDTRLSASEDIWLDGRRDMIDAFNLAVSMASHSKGIAPPDEYAPLDVRILYFLYSRGPQAALGPVLDRDTAQLYRYPAVELLVKEHEDAARTINELHQRGLLEAVALVDRTRHCLKCGGAHIHFLDVCPNCGGIDIHKTPSYHCFTCGHVGPETEFLSRSALSCPQCRTALRHIGVDYDRPLSQYACRACRHVFIEASVIARCLDCGHAADPSELEVREISSMALTTRGRSAVRAGEVQEIFAALENEHYIEPAFFRRLLDWMLATRTRHKEYRFSLLLLAFVNTDEMLAKLDSSRLYLLLNEFAYRLLELLRNTDLITRTEEERLWIILPFSQAKGLADRLLKAIDELNKGRDIPMRVTIKHMDVPGDMEAKDGMTASDAMTFLEAKD